MQRLRSKVTLTEAKFEQVNSGDDSGIMGIDCILSSDDNDPRMHNLHHSVRENMPSSNSLSNESCLGKSRKNAGNFVNNKIVEAIILGMIIVNAAMMGLSTYDIISENEQLNNIFNWTDNVFLVIFTVELSFHLFHLGFRFFRDPWVLFDFILIILSWSFSSGSVKALRALRILRVLPRMETLKVVINSIIIVMPKLGTVAMLLGLVMFVFAILTIELFGDLYERGLTEDDYFSNLWLTSLTLLQMMTFDGWDAIAREVMNVYPSSWVVFVVYVTLTGILCFNIIIAVTCDSVLYMDQDATEKESEAMKQRLKQVQEDLMHLRDVIEDKVHPVKHTINFAPSPSRRSWENSIIDDIDDRTSILPNRGLNRGSMNVNDRIGFRSWCGNFVNSKPIQIFIMSLIIINSLMMAVGTFGFVKDNPSVVHIFDICDTVFLSIYTIESTLQLIFHGLQIYKDEWATFDLFLVITSWVFAFTSLPIQAARSLRLIRILRLIPKLKSLRIIITAIIRVIPKLGGIAGILVLIYYIFAIIFTTLFKESHEYFATLDASMFTLFQIMTMSEWAEISRELDEDIPGSSIMVGTYVIISGFVFLNLIIALICEAMGSIHKVEEEEELAITTKSGKTLSVKISALDRLKYIEESQKILLGLIENCEISPVMDTPPPQASISFNIPDKKRNLRGYDPIIENNQNDLSVRSDNISDIFHDASSDISFDDTRDL